MLWGAVGAHPVPVPACFASQRISKAHPFGGGDAGPRAPTSARRSIGAASIPPPSLLGWGHSPGPITPGCSSSYLQTSPESARLSPPPFPFHTEIQLILPFPTLQSCGCPRAVPALAATTASPRRITRLCAAGGRCGHGCELRASVPNLGSAWGTRAVRCPIGKGRPHGAHCKAPSAAGCALDAHPRAGADICW